MAFQGITFDGQNVSPKDDGALYAAHYGDGILDGCTMSIGDNNDTLVIQSGHIIACGRVCQVNGATELLMDDISQAFVQVYLQYDISQAEGEQWDWGYNQSNSLEGLSQLTQEDINDTGSIYQLGLAILQANNGNITAINSTIGSADIVGNGNVVLSRGGSAAGRITVNDAGTLFNIAKVSNGSSVVGIYGDSTNAEILYAQNGVYLRPNGLNDPSGQMAISTDGSISVGGQITSGHPVTPRTPTGGATVTGSMTQITSLSAGIVSSGVYLVTAECDYQPTASSNVSHYPQFEIQGSIKNTFYTATTGARHYCISGIVTGVSSIVFRGTTQTASTNATVSNIVMNIVRLS